MEIRLPTTRQEFAAGHAVASLDRAALAALALRACRPADVPAQLVEDAYRALCALRAGILGTAPAEQAEVDRDRMWTALTQEPMEVSPNAQGQEQRHQPAVTGAN